MTGYFPAGESMLRRVHGERAVGLLYGQRALLMQATDPVAFTGLVGSTNGLEAPFERLVRTAKIMESVYFGSREEADRVTARVREMHTRVRGAIDEPAGPHPAGTPYAADRPDMLLWILACLADSALVVYRAFVGPLADPGQRERFWSDYLLVGELFGLARADAPPDYDSFRDYMRARVRSDDLFVTGEARTLGRRVAFELPLPARRRAVLPAVNLAVVGTLPPRVRRLYEIPWTPAHGAAFQALARATKLSRPLLPHDVRRGRSARDYEAVARAERRRAAA
ncbi:MAG: hypothetical protein QOC77_1587 [Thermoleophilaceae bacterium]|jgi:uncharacterized protein (DUF2236 family)|nr:hypothetical protein [Thermoleophilaceae bacterium]MEA2470088.1 hypothetical protein [Thermoleophilaceae bacterium]